MLAVAPRFQYIDNSCKFSILYTDNTVGDIQEDWTKVMNIVDVMIPKETGNRKDTSVMRHTFV